jgi:hypothetical protein
MKFQTKAKVMLMSIAIFGIIGGALAFKAKRNSVIYTAENSTAPCTNTLQDFTITKANEPGEQRYASTATDVSCPLTTVTEQI